MTIIQKILKVFEGILRVKSWPIVSYSSFTKEVAEKCMTWMINDIPHSYSDDSLIHPITSILAYLISFFEK